LQCLGHAFSAAPDASAQHNEEALRELRNGLRKSRNDATEARTKRRPLRNASVA
jgi:hypothetical protein